MLRVVAAAVLGSRGLLLVSKRAAPDVFYLPGGKPEPGEPVAGAEIAHVRWWPHDRGLRLAPAVRDEVIPRLAL